MKERGISEETVLGVVGTPDVTYPDGRGNHSYVRTVGGVKVRVVLSGNDPDFVITVIRVDD